MRGNKWYYFIPFAVVVVVVLAYSVGYENAESLWIMLLPAILLEYFIIIFQKRLSKWWFITFIFAGLNVAIYIYFLFAAPRTRETGGQVPGGTE